MRHAKMKAHRPQPERTPTETEMLFVGLTQVEWKTCFAIDWLAGSEDYGPHFADLVAYKTEGTQDDGDQTWLESFKRVVRWLHFEHGFQFEGLEPHQDGRISGRVVQPENLYYFDMLGRGIPPDYLSALTVAIEVLAERAPSLNLEVFRSALADLEEEIRNAPREDPETAQKVDRMSDVALATIGVVRGGGQVN